MRFYSKIKSYYAGMTPAQKARLWTLFVTALGGIAATGDKITQTPFLPAWLLNAWPLIVSADVAILKFISIFTDPNAVARPPVAPAAPENP